MRSLLWRGVFAVFLAALLFSGSSSAQTPTRDKPFPELLDARRWGPVLVDPSWRIQNIGYDGNVFLVPDSVPKETDWFIRTGPDLRGQLRFGRHMALTFHDEFIWELYASHSDLNQTSNDFDGQYDLLLGPVLLTTKGRWASTFGRPNNELDQRTRLDRTEIGETARFFIGSRTDLSTTFSVERMRYNDPDYLVSIDPGGTGDIILLPIDNALNRDRKRWSTEWGWRPRGRTRLFAKYAILKDDFISDVRGRDVEERRQTLGVEFVPNAFLSGRFEFGKSKLENLDKRFDFTPYNGTVSDTKLVYRPTGSTRVTADYERNVKFSTYENNLYFRETLTGLHLESYLGNNWGFQLGGNIRQLDYPEKNTITRPIGEKRSDEITDYFGGILLRLSGGVNFSLRIGRRVRTSNVKFAEDNQTYFSTSSSYRF